MKNTVFAFCILMQSLLVCAQNEPFTKRTVASGFNSAWEVTYGPSDSLWVTENKAYTVDRISIANGGKTILLNLLSGVGNDATINFSATGAGGRPIPAGWPQGGLMGLAIHPNLFSSIPAVRALKPWVYIVYAYNNVDCAGTNTHCIFKSKIIRYDYVGNALINPVIVLDNIPGSSDHNSGRLVISPAVELGVGGGLNTQYRLYYTIGDMGCGQFLNTTRTENAQNVDVMEGKVLRLNTETDGDAGLDAWVPDDNPFYNAVSITPKDYVYTLGHRNPQGLVWGTVGGSNILYSSEQMDKTDDEINVIEAGKNYGWDQVSGYGEGNMDCSFVGQYKIGQNNDIHEAAFCSVPANNNKLPIFTVFTATAAQMPAVNVAPNSAWPTVACSSIDFYGPGGIPGWRSSLLITPLKKDLVYRIKLDAPGTGVVGDTINYFRGDGNRIRDIAISPDGTKFYVARDIGATFNGGAIMEYSYIGALLSIKDNQNQTPKLVSDLIRVYPNPVKDVINVQGKKELHKPLFVQLFDINGKLLREATSFQNSFTINIADFKRGIYTLKLYNGYEMEVQIEKIIKQ